MQLLAAGQSPLTNPAMMMLLANPPPADAAAPAPGAPAAPSATTDTAPAAPTAASTVDAAPTPVLLLEQMVSPSDLTDDSEFDDLLLDIQEECEKFGRVRRLVIPRPLITTSSASTTNSAPSTDSGPRVADDAGVGRIFVEFETTSSAVDARQKLHGRRFNASTVVATFYDQDKFDNKQYV